MGKIVEKMNNAQNCLYSTKQYELGYKYALEAYMMNPDNPETKYLYAVALYFNDRCEEALKYFYELEKILKYPDALCIYIAHCLSKTRKNLLLALKYINKAAKLYHYDQETKIQILMLKAEILYRMGNYDSALEKFLRAYKMGDDDKSLCYIAKIYLLKDEFMKAMKYMRILYRMDDPNPESCWIKLRNSDTNTWLEFLEYLLKRYEIKNKENL